MARQRQPTDLAERAEIGERWEAGQTVRVDGAQPIAGADAEPAWEI